MQHIPTESHPKAPISFEVDVETCFLHLGQMILIGLDPNTGCRMTSLTTICCGLAVYCKGGVGGGPIKPPIAERNFTTIYDVQICTYIIIMFNKLKYKHHKYNLDIPWDTDV